MKKEWIDVCSYDGEGYLPLITYQSWRVAELRYCEELEVKNLDKMQKHDETDEVFVLLAGRMILYLQVEMVMSYRNRRYKDGTNLKYIM